MKTNDEVRTDVQKLLKYCDWPHPVTRVEPIWYPDFNVYERRKDGTETLLGVWNAERKEFTK